jgi:hypothetical protein
MPDPQQQRDIDFLLEFREFKGVVNTKLDRAINDIQDLKDGTATKIADHEKRIETMENDRYLLKASLALGIVILGLIIWHLTGYNL